MIATLFLALLAPSPALCAPSPGPGALPCEPAGPRTPQDDPAKQFEGRFAAAGDDVQALWDLYLWTDAAGLTREGRRCLRKIVRLDPQHRPANEALGHIFYQGRWFVSERKLAEFKKEEEERAAKEKGLVRFGEAWVPEADLPYLERGLVRDETGAWIDKEEHEKLQAGWRRQDLLWIAPEEVHHLDEGLWKCGEQWLSLEEADKYHSQVGRWWSIPTEHFVLHTTCAREVADKAIDLLYLAAHDLQKVVGVQPDRRVPVVLLDSHEQYLRVSSGNSVLGNVETHGLSSVHHAFFADLWFDAQGGFHGAGIAYWDASSDVGNSYGVHALRNAAAHSFLEAVDPSPKQLERTLRARGQVFDAKAFWAEKRFPEWFRYGAAAYVERYYTDSTVAVGGNPYWVREWSVHNITNRGGLRPLQQIFGTKLEGLEPRDAEKLLNERGLVVAFLVDGGAPALAEAHGELTAQIAEGGDLKPVFAKIEKLVVENEQQLREFADL